MNRCERMLCDHNKVEQELLQQRQRAHTAMLKLERKYTELSRWSEDTEQYKSTAKLYFEHKKKEQLSIVQIGYKRAKKTTQAMSKAASKLGESILTYNNLSEQSAYFFEDSTSAIQPLTMADVIASDCWIWQHFDGLQTAENVQTSTQ
ncbi:9954_t:CDS:2 [Paraglomus occultum]|uniref:9954_t:CDS:1 n=1 Tax=Paraglomus occultum TaxID=144539 RepID=A0A9N9AL57_9GLOM|nr:9954_t:CDS:2 [Paraglomus occultum]